MKPWVFYWCALLILCELMTLAGASEESRAAPLIIGGHETKASEYPEVVDLDIFHSNGGMSICTATFVSANTLLTAAHCVIDSNIDIVTPSGTTVQKIYIPETYRRTTYDLDKVNSDIALILLKTKITQQPIRQVSQMPALGNATMVGFGGNTLMTVAQLNQKNDPGVGIKRVGTAKLEFISPIGRMDSRREVFQARHWYHFNDARSAKEPHLALSSRGDSGGPLIQNGKVIGVISGVDRTDQDETTVYSSKTYFAGLHTRDFDEIASQAIADGSTLKR